jgi:hypothetical protein
MSNSNRSSSIGVVVDNTVMDSIGGAAKVPRVGGGGGVGSIGGRRSFGSGTRNIISSRPQKHRNQLRLGFINMPLVEIRML